MELFTNQILAGIRHRRDLCLHGARVVMIYQAIDHLNFAQGEMAMFSTFISWQLMQWGIPYWGAFRAHAGPSSPRHPDRAAVVQAAGKGADPDQRGRFHRAIMGSSTACRPDLGLHHQQYPTPFGSTPFLGRPADLDPPGRHDRVTLLLLIALYFFFQFTRIGLAMRAAAALPESARLVGINTSWMIRAWLGHGGGDRLDRRHADRAGGCFLEPKT